MGLFFIFFVLLLGCRQPDRVLALRERAEFLHDSIMPMSGELMRLKRQCQQMALEFDSIRPELADSFRNQALELENAYNAMMDWMHNYVVPDENTPEDVVTAYFEDEIRAIQAVGKAYDLSMTHAADLIQRYEN